jgi:hypothetical protein
MRDTYTTKRNGIELKLRGVEPLALHNILYRVGLSKTASRDEISKHVDGKTQEGKQRTLEAINQLFGYCFTQGIETTAPDNAMDELEAMGFPTGKPNLTRLYWLRHVELEDEREAGEILGIIMGLTFAPGVVEKEKVQDEEVED